MPYIKEQNHLPVELSLILDAFLTTLLIVSNKCPVNAVSIR